MKLTFIILIHFTIIIIAVYILIITEILIYAYSKTLENEIFKKIKLKIYFGVLQNFS